MFVGLGQALGRAFDAYPDRVRGYVLNIGGSLAGIVAFSALSLLETPPPLWFLISSTGIGYLLWQTGGLTVVRTLSLVALLVGVGEAEWLWQTGEVRQLVALLPRHPRQEFRLHRGQRDRPSADFSVRDRWRLLIR